MIDYYNLLGVKPTAHRDEIRAAFRRHAKHAHPDAHPNLPESEKAEMQRRFIRLAQAYEILSRPERRSEYDRKLRAAKMRTAPSSARPTARPGARPGVKPSSTTSRPATSGGRKTAGQGAPGPRPQAQRPPPPGQEQDLEDLLQDVDQLLNRFGLSMRNQFGEMLDKTFQWALGVFLEVAQALEESARQEGREEERARSSSQRGGGGFSGKTPPEETPSGADKPHPRPAPPPPPPRERELEEELEALKEQVHMAVARAEAEKATPQTMEEELERLKKEMERGL